jgi:hypothetical protein
MMIIIYDYQIFIAQATAVSFIKLFCHKFTHISVSYILSAMLITLIKGPAYKTSK